MAVRKGQRFVKISSPVSILAIGLVFTCGALALLFSGNILPDDVISEEFKIVFFWGGVYMAVIGIPSILIFIFSVLSPPKDVTDASSISLEKILSYFIGSTMSIGLIGTGSFLFFTKKNFMTSGIVLICLGVLFLMMAIPAMILFNSEEKKVKSAVKKKK